ncbi:unnamed protein product [Schistocephalus solidus]|uniref:Lipase maturation factor 2 n=1 Tax=Schistocephalus solidus TaxID=70667 RepID=A0A183SGZ7_SCHSO|nr:unnamed protein product [Schistocephalus solidus]
MSADRVLLGVGLVYFVAFCSLYIQLPGRKRFYYLATDVYGCLTFTHKRPVPYEHFRLLVGDLIRYSVPAACVIFGLTLLYSIYTALRARGCMRKMEHLTVVLLTGLAATGLFLGSSASFVASHEAFVGRSVLLPEIAHEFARSLRPLHLANDYRALFTRDEKVFVQPSPTGRATLVFEGSMSEKGPWTELSFFASPSKLDRMPPVLFGHSPVVDFELALDAYKSFDQSPLLANIVYRILTQQKDAFLATKISHSVNDNECADVNENAPAEISLLRLVHTCYRSCCLRHKSRPEGYPRAGTGSALLEIVSLAPIGLMLGRIELGDHVNKADGRRLLVAIAEFKNATQFEYLVRASMPNTESDLIEPRPRVREIPESLEQDNDEYLRNIVDEVVLASCFASLLEDRYSDARVAVESPCLFNQQQTSYRNAIHSPSFLVILLFPTLSGSDWWRRTLKSVYLRPTHATDPRLTKLVEKFGLVGRRRERPVDPTYLSFILDQLRSLIGQPRDITPFIGVLLVVLVLDKLVL